MPELNEDKKRVQMDELKEHREKILNATRADVLRQEVSLLEATLTLMRINSSGEIRETVDRTLQEIESLKMYDKTRWDLARWVQTLISQLNQ